MACIDSTVGAVDSRYFVTFSSIHRKDSCQTVAGAFPVCQVDTPEVAFSRNFQQRFKFHHFLMCHVIFFHGWGTIHRFADRVLSLEITRVFGFLAQEFLPRSHSIFFFGPPAQPPGSSSSVYVSDATLEPGVHT